MTRAPDVVAAPSTLRHLPLCEAITWKASPYGCSVQAEFAALLHTHWMTGATSVVTAPETFTHLPVERLTIAVGRTVTWARAGAASRTRGARAAASVSTPRRSRD